MSSKSRLRPKLSLRLMLISVGVIAVLLGFLSYRIRVQQDSVHRLRDLGGQMDVPDVNVSTWITGMSVTSVRFLGPACGDESIDEIGNASNRLSVEQITFFETRVTPYGLDNLKMAIPDTEIRLIGPSILPLPGLPVRQQQLR